MSTLQMQKPLLLLIGGILLFFSCSLVELDESAALVFALPQAKQAQFVGMDSWTIEAQGPDNASFKKAMPLDTTSSTITSLKPGEWTFRILALDAQENPLYWGETSVVLEKGMNALSITMRKVTELDLELESIYDVELTLSASKVSVYANGVQTSTYTIQASEGFDSYSWFIDGTPYVPAPGEVPTDTPNKLISSAAAFVVARKVSVICESDGEYFSADVTLPTGCGY